MNYDIPLKNPEKFISPSDSLALQTYEYFAGGDERSENTEDFTQGKTLQPKLDYPSLSSSSIDRHIQNLTILLPENSLSETDSPVSASVEYRLAEAYFLKTSEKLNNPLGSISQEQVDYFQKMNQEIYGEPDMEIFNTMLNFIWQNLEQKRGPATDKIVSELETGFTFESENGERLEIPALPSPQSIEATTTLPELTPEASEWVRSKILEEIAPAKTAIEEYYTKEIEPREDKAIYPEDMIVLLQIGKNALGLGDVEVIANTNATALSWSSADSAIVVGMKRKPFTDVNSLLGVFAHEVMVHGRRYINGKNLGDESLANGLFTEADEGEDPSYLTFEEGLATMIQNATLGKGETWNIASMGHYLNIVLAHMGWSPRQIQEVMYRIRTVLKLDSKTETLDRSIVEKSKQEATTGIVRVFRGTPTDKELRTSSGVTLHYAKDLAYASGRVKAMKHLNEIVMLPEDQRNEAWQKLFQGKFDPTNHHQSAYLDAVLSRSA